MESTKYLLVGGGIASLNAAMAIRERDKEGRVLIVCSENHPPYDRPPLSKNMLVNDEMKTDDPYSKFDNYYPDNSIGLMKGHAVASIDREAKKARLDNGNEIGYEKLLLATGSHIRELDIPGADLPDVFYLRYIENSEGIRAALHRTRRAVIIGSSYMGLEVASGCIRRGIETTIVDQTPEPWGKFASDDLATFMRREYEKKGARFILGKPVAALVQQGGYIQVHTEGGEAAEGNIAIACVGHQQNLNLAQEAGLQVDQHGVVTDNTLQTSDPYIWAAGDIASFDDVAMGKHWHAEHFLHARWTGKRAGANMAGDVAPYDEVPYFFSDFLDLHMVLRGDPQAGKAARVLGSIHEGEFVELYADEEGTLKMGVGMSHDEKRVDPWADKLEELIRAKPKAAEVKVSDFGL